MKYILLSVAAFLSIGLMGYAIFLTMKPDIIPAALKPAEPAAPDVASAPKGEEATNGWTKRCTDGEAGESCEVFQRLISDDTQQRIAEFAVGQPGSETAQGVAILPLGVLLPAGGTMRIDEGNVYRFQFRYCTAAGCFAYLNLNSKLLAEMTAGQTLVFQCKAADGQYIDVKMPLSGLEESLAGLSATATP